MSARRMFCMSGLTSLTVWVGGGRREEGGGEKGGGWGRREEGGGRGMKILNIEPNMILEGFKYHVRLYVRPAFKKSYASSMTSW